MAGNGIVNIRVALAFAAVVTVGAGLVAANFDGVTNSSQYASRDAESDYGETTYEDEGYGTDVIDPEPGSAPDAAAGGPQSAAPDGWYETPYDDVEPGQPLDDARGFEPSPVLPPRPLDEDYVILDGDGSLNGEYPEGY